MSTLTPDPLDELSQPYSIQAAILRCALAIEAHTQAIQELRTKIEALKDEKHQAEILEFKAEVNKKSLFFQIYDGLGSPLYKIGFLVLVGLGFGKIA